MRKAVFAALALAATTACREAASEPTTVETEALVYRCIAEHCPDATILAIAHRPPPAGLFDRRILLENGRVTVLAARETASA